MLKQRVLTALLLLPPVLAAVWFLPTAWFVALFGAAALVAAHEWSRLAACTTRARQLGFVAGTAGLIALLVADRWPALRELALAAALLWWIWMIRWVAIYPRGFGPADPPAWLRVAAGLVVIPAAVSAMAALHESPQGPLRVLFLLFLVWAADVGAYFAGRALGRRKLAPNVSPGKTWEGVAGGLALAAVIIGAAGVWVFGAQGLEWLGLFALGLSVVALSIVGDLGESLLKRQAGVKDSGTLLPGHGGMLDRADSLLAAAPALALGLHWIGL